jgi:carbon storage regulator
MLVLSRKTNQTIVIDGNIEIQVLKIKGNTVRLGIKAPSTIKVLRGELSPFETPACEEVAETPAGYIKEELDRLPNPFAVSHAS